jgi:hypothetical protein
MKLEIKKKGYLQALNNGSDIFCAGCADGMLLAFNSGYLFICPLF